MLPPHCDGHHAMMLLSPAGMTDEEERRHSERMEVDSSCQSIKRLTKNCVDHTHDTKLYFASVQNLVLRYASCSCRLWIIKCLWWCCLVGCELPADFVSADGRMDICTLLDCVKILYSMYRIRFAVVHTGNIPVRRTSTRTSSNSEPTRHEKRLTRMKHFCFVTNTELCLSNTVFTFWIGFLRFDIIS